MNSDEITKPQLKTLAGQIRKKLDYFDRLLQNGLAQVRREGRLLSPREKARDAAQSSG